MKAILEMERMGFQFVLDGGMVRYTHEGERPDSGEVKVFLEYLRRHRDEVVQFLRERADAPSPDWVGQPLKIEDLPAFKEEWGLRTLSSEWPQRDRCPTVFFEPIQADFGAA